MPITTSCPGCKSLFRLTEELAGKQARCQKCDRMFVVPMLGLTFAAPADSSEPPAPPPAPTPPPESSPAVAPPIVDKPILVAPRLDSHSPEVKPTSSRETRPSRAWLYTAVFLYTLGIAATSTFASVWVALHLAAPARAMLVAPYRGNNRDGVDRKPPHFDHAKDNFRNHDKRDDFKDDVKKIERPIEPTDIFPRNDGKTELRGFLAWPLGNAGRFGNEGPFRLYRIVLVEGTSYNFYIGSWESGTRLKIFDPDDQVVTRMGTQTTRRLLMNYRPRRTGEHLLFITSPAHVACNFDLKIASETQRGPQRVFVQPNVNIDDELFLHDPIDAQVPFNGGPYREYLVTLEAGKQYALHVTAVNYAPVLHILNRDGVLLPRGDIRAQAGAKWLDSAFTAPYTGDYRIRVTSEDYGLGTYSLIVTRK